MKKFRPQPGFTVLAHKLALDPNAAADRRLYSHGGAARAAYNWAGRLRHCCVVAAEGRAVLRHS
ncbi:helix-turn-helix domain-containing protein [Streptomyces sp. NPDC057136]|uniref:helix-turn-helix domain-containing protein n=1 Tax=Streptomyces sp. NPDC057136 TaxID=3346029 RepID=UPI003638DBFA